MSHGIFNDPTEHAIAARIDYTGGVSKTPSQTRER